MLKIAYISGEPKGERQQPKRLSEKDRIHREAVATVAVQRMHDKLKAARLFEVQRREVEALRERRDALMRIANSN